MPRYKFQCTECQHVEVIFLQISEENENNCSNCNSTGTLQKQFDKFYSKTTHKGEQKIGTITKEYIEKNKAILEDQKKEARSEEYEPS